MAEDVGGDRRQLRDQPHALEIAVGRVGDVLRVRVEGREGADRAEQHPHRVRVVAEALQELVDVRVHVGVHPDVVRPLRELALGRELALEQEVGRLQEPGLLGDLLDRIAAVAEDAGVAVDVGDRAAARCRVQERRVVRHEPLAVGARDLAQVGRADGAVHDRQRVLRAGAVVDDGESVSAQVRCLLGRDSPYTARERRRAGRIPRLTSGSPRTRRERRRGRTPAPPTPLGTASA